MYSIPKVLEKNIKIFIDAIILIENLQLYLIIFNVLCIRICELVITIYVYSVINSYYTSNLL